MLVLSRKENQQIVIDKDIVVTVVQIRGNKVRLGISAPKDVPVHREEVHEAIRSQKVLGRDNREGVGRYSLPGRSAPTRCERDSGHGEGEAAQ